MTHKPTHANNSSLWRLTSFDTQGQQIDTQRDNDTRIVPGKKRVDNTNSRAHNDNDNDEDTIRTKQLTNARIVTFSLAKITTADAAAGGRRGVGASG